jgi:hypothetical protein
MADSVWKTKDSEPERRVKLRETTALDSEAQTRALGPEVQTQNPVPAPERPGPVLAWGEGAKKPGSEAGQEEKTMVPAAG